MTREEQLAEKTREEREENMTRGREEVRVGRSLTTHGVRPH